MNRDKDEPEPEPEIYRVKWKSSTNGKSGIGTFKFTKMKAEEICRGLNFDYPEIVHEPHLDSEQK